MSNHTIPLYEIMRQNLLRLIETEHISYLPNEKDLMTRYQVSRNTLRRAIHELTMEGILQPMQGIGTLVHPLSGVQEDSRILVICGDDFPVWQQESFHELLLKLGQSKLRTSVLVIDRQHVDMSVVDAHLKECDVVIVDMSVSFCEPVIAHVAMCGKKRICMHWKTRGSNLPSVTADVEGGMFDLMNHLMDLGHRKFLFMVNGEDARRRRGIDRALEKYSMDFASSHVVYDYRKGQSDREQGMRVARQAIAELNEETAIVCNNDIFALCVEEVAMSAGLRIPQDISVVGFDNIAESAYFPVPLTTCSCNIHEVIQETIAYLFSSRKPTESFFKQLPTALVIRESTGPAKEKANVGGC